MDKQCVKSGNKNVLKGGEIKGRGRLPAESHSHIHPADDNYMVLVGL